MKEIKERGSGGREPESGAFREEVGETALRSSSGFRAKSQRRMPAACFGKRGVWRGTEEKGRSAR